ncbi:hypothetical protein D3C80_692240 [compost metagenome]
MVEACQVGRHRHQQHPQHHRGQVGLDAEPGDGDHRADDGRQLRTVDAETHAADHRERHPGFLPHVTREVHEEVHQHGTDAQCREHLPAGQAEGEQAHGEGIVGDVVHIVGPQGKNAVTAPAPAFSLGRRKVGVVQPGAQGPLLDRRGLRWQVGGLQRVGSIQLHVPRAPSAAPECRCCSELLLDLKSGTAVLALPCADAYKYCIQFLYYDFRRTICVPKGSQRRTCLLRCRQLSI